MRLHFLSFCPSGPSFWLLGLHFRLWGVHFATSGLEGGYPLALCVLLGLQGVSFCSLRLFEPSGGYPSQLRASDRGPPPPQVAKNGPFSQGPIQRIYQRRGRVDFPIFGLVGVDFLHFGFVRLPFLGLHFSFSASILAFGASLLPLRALRGGLLWLFVAFWAFRGGTLLLFVAF